MAAHTPTPAIELTLAQTQAILELQQKPGTGVHLARIESTNVQGIVACTTKRETVLINANGSTLSPR